MHRFREYLAVIRDIDTGLPCAMYDESSGRFLRFEEVKPGVAMPPKGTYFDCLFKNELLRIWQMYDRDYWYTERLVESDRDAM